MVHWIKPGFDISQCITQSLRQLFNACLPHVKVMSIATEDLIFEFTGFKSTVLSVEV